ncbi:hypothetical protein ABZY83_28525, partial [Streptomyces virginiae]|uniref:hypothetical protein n=1 Tax=Streptomyces virginiae TaxID=1961 RepID=UPI0033A0275B
MSAEAASEAHPAARAEAHAATCEAHAQTGPDPAAPSPEARSGATPGSARARTEARRAFDTHAGIAHEAHQQNTQVLHD